VSTKAFSFLSFFINQFLIQSSHEIPAINQTLSGLSLDLKPIIFILQRLVFLSHISIESLHSVLIQNTHTLFDLLGSKMLPIAIDPGVFGMTFADFHVIRPATFNQTINERLF
jgi:hypothetical protein